MQGDCHLLEVMLGSTMGKLKAQERGPDQIQTRKRYTIDKKSKACLAQSKTSGYAGKDGWCSVKNLGKPGRSTVIYCRSPRPSDPGRAVGQF
ncbi:hypothetical protein NDU88_001848 [Pleurodeles waltl]|uniref:Uncharacterized protein n=1 Tax=Pleurodeles waltl TaxID=8319 RepID=A0AAV7U8C5_PLEWA|nr:hypothetical protein NDU88_001848 [Pleurodeles waltl]